MRYIYVLLVISITFISCLTCKEKSADNDAGQYTKVIERFFVNGQENKLNSPHFYYYDANNNLLKYTSLNKNGEEYINTAYKYENNELVEYIDRWGTQGFIEKIEENGNVVTITREKNMALIMIDPMKMVTYLMSIMR
jgi:hypothetical protein